MVEIRKVFGNLIEGFKAVALDTQVFIYHFQENRVYLPMTQAIFEAIEQREMKASTSVMTMMEILVKPMREGNAKAVEDYKFVLQTFPNLKLQAVDAAVSEKAAEVRAEYNLRSPDAIQLASAMAANAEAFVTNDHRLKRVKGIHVILLKDYKGTEDA